MEYTVLNFIFFSYFIFFVLPEIAIDIPLSEMIFYTNPIHSFNKHLLNAVLVIISNTSCLKKTLQNLSGLKQ